MARTRLFLSAIVEFDQGSNAVRVRDLSPSGARIEGVGLPDVGTPVTLRRGDLLARATIVWRNARGVGLHFEPPLRIERWMPVLATSEQGNAEASDGTILPFPSAKASAPEEEDAVLPQRLAEELAYVVRLLESLKEDLCAEPLLALRHATKLQNLDVSAQILGNVAAVLIADEPDRAIDSIKMPSLRKRLQRVPL